MAKKRVAIVQSNYIPWKGYFDLIHSVDEFILYDTVQYTRRDWRNRNRIKTPRGPAWLTIPVDVKGKYLQRICDTVISEPGWTISHWETLRLFYAKAPHFVEYRDELEELYRGCRETHLSRINHRFLSAICVMLGIRTPLTYWDETGLPEEKTERLVALCERAGAGLYLSGPAAKVYLRTELFLARGIEVAFFDYTGYPEYDQLYPPFTHEVTVLDLLFMAGRNAPSYMKSFGK